MMMVATFVVLAMPTASSAQSPRLSLVRDAEIEALVKDYARPLMRAAGLRNGSVKFYIVNNNNFNAFVSGSGMFIHTGLLLQAENPNEVIGVIAHELGHIIGGHQIGLRQRIERASKIARITALLGAGIGVAGAASGNSDVGRAGLSLATSGGRFGLRDLLKYRRGEETNADDTAVRLLHKTKQSGKGMLSTFRRLARATSIVSGRIDPYLQSHPSPNRRIEALRSAVEKSPYYNRQSSKNLRLRHDLVRAKIAAYTGANRYARAVLGDRKLHPLAREYGRAIVSHLYGSPRKAIPQIERLAKKLPKSAYIQEMKGEILLRSGKASKAVAPFRNALKLDRTKAGFIRVELGHALLESGNRKNLKEAVVQLRKGLARDPTAIAGHQYLAIAYGRLGQRSQALLSSAEFALRRGKKNEAKNFANRAQKGFKRGQPGWLRAQDIISLK